jgi:hypothetical protein
MFMKLRHLILMGVPLLLGTSCVYSHRHAAVYSATPNAVVVAPTSDRPVVRVYPERNTTKAVVVERNTPGSAAPADLAIADSVRQMYDADPSLASRVTNVKTTVYGGRVTLEGAVPTRADKRELERRLATIPGVTEINDRLDVGVPGR